MLIASYFVELRALPGGVLCTLRLRKEVQTLKELNPSLQESTATIEQNDLALRDHAEKLGMGLTILAKWI